LFAGCRAENIERFSISSQRSQRAHTYSIWVFNYVESPFEGTLGHSLLLEYVNRVASLVASGLFSFARRVEEAYVSAVYALKYEYGVPMELFVRDAAFCRDLRGYTVRPTMRQYCRDRTRQRTAFAVLA
jgi:hypothetical protein